MEWDEEEATQTSGAIVKDSVKRIALNTNREEGVGRGDEVETEKNGR